MCEFVIGFAEHVGCESALIEADSTLAAHDSQQEKPGERNEGGIVDVTACVRAAVSLQTQKLIPDGYES